MEVFHPAVVQIVELIVVEVSVFKSAADDALDLCLLQLGHHAVHVVRLHLRSFEGNDGAEVEKVGQCAAILIGLLAHFGRDFGCLGQYGQGAIRGKVEGVADRFHAAIMRVRCLHAEDSLHVGRGGGLVSAGHHKDTRPRGDANARGESAARESDGVGLVGVRADGVLDHLEGVAVLHLVVHVLLLIAITGHVDDLEMGEDGVLAELLAERTCSFDAGQHPQGMAKDVAVFLPGVGVERLGVITTE